jgi:NADH dehydrogenase FAD-containing subunit
MKEQCVMTKKNVLVIGGGAAGHQIAYQLRDTANVTLVDPKTYWEVPMALPRLLVEPDGLPARMRYDSFLGAATHVQGKVVSLEDGAARVALGTGEQQTLAYDYAVIASGSAYMDPLIKAQAKTEENRSAEIAAMNALLRTARSVVVAGGGPWGSRRQQNSPRPSRICV